jgi:4-hydroxy-2-oxoheptanedioate aldolase
MTGQEIAARLKQGQPVFGTSILADSPSWPSAAKRAGLDFVFLDTEHVARDRVLLAWMCQAYRAVGLTPIIRVPKPDPFQACVALDGGAGGIIFPYVETAEQAQTLRGAVKLRPLKGRKLADVLSGKVQLSREESDYLTRWNQGNLMICNIESSAAIEALDDILAVPGLDAVLVGPHDLSVNLGIPEQFDHPRFEEAVQTIIRKARARHVGAGVHFWFDVERQAKWIRDGATFIIQNNDITAFQNTLAADMRRLREVAGQAPPAAPEAATGVIV